MSLMSVWRIRAKISRPDLSCIVVLQLCTMICTDKCMVCSKTAPTPSSNSNLRCQLAHVDLYDCKSVVVSC